MKKSSNKQFLLVEPISTTPYPPLGLMKISSMLKHKHKNSEIISCIGKDLPKKHLKPEKIFITTLFTWNIKKDIEIINFYKKSFPKSYIIVGGIAASLMPDYFESATGIKPHIGLYEKSESFKPDYDLGFGRKIKTSITFTTRGCIRKCKFCQVNTLEPDFFVRNDWEKDIDKKFNLITLWDNNFLASPNFKEDCKKLQKLGKKVDFNQGLDARLYSEEKAKILSKLDIDPIRFAFDNIAYEKDVLKAINLAKKYSKKEIRVYVLYNYDDTPEDFYHRINLLNKKEVLAFPMQYRDPNDFERKYPGKNWNVYLLRAMSLSLLYYYRKGMITPSRNSFEAIYGKTPIEFVNKLYKIYEYDKQIKRKKK